MSQLCVKPPVIAHRGASGYAPENTLAAFTKAAQLGIRWIEFDVMLSACETPVVFHDDELWRTTKTHGSIADHPYAYLRSLDVGAWFGSIFSGERIPNLEQVLDLMANANLCANLEIKPLPGQDKKTTNRVLETVRAFNPGLIKTILFSSFSLDALQALREQAPEANIGLLMDDCLPDWLQRAEELQCVSVHVSNRVLDEQLTSKIKQSGYQVLCYTVNEAARAKQLFSWGVDAVFSDVPDKILSA